MNGKRELENRKTREKRAWKMVGMGIIKKIMSGRVLYIYIVSMSVSVVFLYVFICIYCIYMCKCLIINILKRKYFANLRPSTTNIHK